MDQGNFALFELKMLFGALYYSTTAPGLITGKNTIVNIWHSTIGNLWAVYVNKFNPTWPYLLIILALVHIYSNKHSNVNFFTYHCSNFSDILYVPVTSVALRKYIKMCTVDAAPYKVGGDMVSYKLFLLSNFRTKCMLNYHTRNAYNDLLGGLLCLLATLQKNKWKYSHENFMIGRPWYKEPPGSF